MSFKIFKSILWSVEWKLSLCWKKFSDNIKGAAEGTHENAASVNRSGRRLCSVHDFEADELT
eukprot:scaffold3851_cov191-Pinguiococcus_pyrenoidosus.AAC.1